MLCAGNVRQRRPLRAWILLVDRWNAERRAREEAAEKKRGVRRSARKARFATISKALAPLNLELKPVLGVAEVPQLVGAAVRARSDILSAREGATDTQ